VDAFKQSIGTRTISGKEALEVAKKNPNRQWSVGMESACARFNSGDYMSVNHVPKFKLDRNDPVFTIGSCFAREIENVLDAFGVPLLLAGHGVVAERYESWNQEKQTGGGVAAGKISRGVFHKYTTHSMYFDVDRALIGTKYPNEGLLELVPGKWFDPHSAGLPLTDLETALENRASVDLGMAQIKKAKVILITLGLTESWMEKVNGLVVNRVPPGNYLYKRSDLFDYVDFGYEDVYRELVKLIELLREKLGGIKIIVTVSPVPSSTFRERDVLETVSSSKSILRTAAEMVCRSYDFIDYFPSYELAINSPREKTWKEDGVHVQWDMVKRITNTFIEAYY